MRAYNDSMLEVHGGKFDFVTADREHPESDGGDGSVVNIHGGTVGVAKTYWPSTMNIFAGEISAINPLNKWSDNERPWWYHPQLDA